MEQLLSPPTLGSTRDGKRTDMGLYDSHISITLPISLPRHFVCFLSKVEEDNGRLIFGAIPWVKHLLIGETAPLRVVQDSMILLGDGTIPCLTLILGGNLTQGLRKRSVGPMIIIAVIIVRYLILPIIGIGVIKMAATLGLLPADPLFSFMLLIMFALPPGVNISTMAQLFNVGQEECAMLMMWTYLASAFSLTAWSTLYIWILS
ncbi:PIN-LIKES 7-like protein [Tanacetum coccineum]